MKWFKHDSDASNDAKLRKLRLKFGAEGYAVYWYCLELVARNVDAHNLTFILEHDAALIADDFKLKCEHVIEMLDYMVDLGLLEESDGQITCLKMATRTDEYTKKLMASSGRDLKQNIGKSESVRTISDKNKEAPTNQRNPKFKPPSIKEVALYCEERANRVDPEKFVDHYSANGWVRGKTPIKDWKAAVRTWERNCDSTSQGSASYAGLV